MTELGIIGNAPIADIGPGGAIAALSGAGPTIDWWVGADDRWHRATFEVAARQGLANDGSTIETRMRVPGGDIVHRVSAAPAAGSGVVVGEIVNETSVPVAIAITLHGARSIDVHDDVVVVDGRAAVRAGRSVARVVAADTLDHLLATLGAGNAGPPAEADLPFSAAHGAAVFPLPHTATLRFVAALPGGADALPPLDRLPSLHDIGRGWRAHLDGAMRIDVPDDRLTMAVEAACRHLLGGSLLDGNDAFWSVDTPPWAPAVGAVALGVWGHALAVRDLLVRVTEADRLGVGASGSAVRGGALLWAWAEVLGANADPDLLDALRPWIVERVGDLVARAPSQRRWRRRSGEALPSDAPWRALGLASAAQLLTMLDQRQAASDVVDALPAFAAEVPPDSIAAVLGGHRVDADGRSDAVARALGEWVGREAVTVEMLGALSESTGAIAGPERRHDPVASSLLLLAVRRALVYEPMGVGGPVEVFGGVRDAWFGSAMEVLSAPIAGGRVDVAVRWHGTRPALLWDLRSSRPLQLEAPSLDPSWSDERSAAEALLAPTPALVVEAGPESPRVRRGEDLEPGEGDPGSFG